MVVPLIFALILSVLVGRAAKKFNRPGTGPVSVAVGCMILFAVATRGAIRVRPNELAKGVLLGVLLYFAVALIIYVAIYLWLRWKHGPPADRGEPAAEAPQRFGEIPGTQASSLPVFIGLWRFWGFLGIQGPSIQWKYPLGIFIGFVAMQIVVLLRVGHSGFIRQVIQSAVIVAILVAVFFLLRRLHYLIVTVAVALTAGILNFGINTILQGSFYMDIVLEFVFVLVFVLGLVWLLNRMKNPWIALAIGFFLALTISYLVLVVYISTQDRNVSIFDLALLNVQWLWRVLYTVVFTGAVFGLYRILQMDLLPIIPGKNSPVE
jgi:hypothetical protein